MKQTKSALSMLLNAYRAVFKAAYFKGMASAVVLTAGLAAGAANAAVNPSFSTAFDSDHIYNSVTVTETGNTVSGNQVVYADDVSIGSGSALEIAGALANVGDINVGQSGSLTVTGAINSNDVVQSGGKSVAADWTGSLTVNGGTVNVSGTVQTSDVSLINANVTIGKASVTTNQHNQGAYIIGGYGVGDNNVIAAQNSTINFNGYGFLQSNDELIVTDSELNFSGAVPTSYVEK